MQKLTKVLLLAGAVGLVVASGAVRAQDSPHAFTGKIALYSEYEYRGISQTSEKPALQLNLDYAHASGFYVGTFVSNIKWLKDTAESLGDSTDAQIEWDIYGGYKWGFAKDWTLDVGYLRYEYPSSKAFPGILLKPNTDEVYIGVSFGPATLKYSHAISEIFGVPESKGSSYLELAVNYPVIDKVTLNALVGYQKYKGTQVAQGGLPFNNDEFSYMVWKLGATYDFGGGFAAGAYYKGTDAEPVYFTFLGKDWSKDRLVAFVSYSF